jgi:uncharacterized protein
MRLPDHRIPVVSETVRLRVEEDPALSEVEARLELSALVATIPEGEVPSRLRLRGRLCFSRRLACARCLAESEISVDSTFESLIDLEAGTIEASDIEAEPEPGGYRRHGANEIDFGEEIRQRVHLAAPEIGYCRADCKGLCSQCGQDLNARECGCDRGVAGGPFEALRSLIETPDEPRN